MIVCPVFAQNRQEQDSQSNYFADFSILPTAWFCS